MKKRSLHFLKKLILVLFPSLFLILGILIHYSYGRFYIVNTDPEYFHLLNGLNIAIVNLAVDYIHHPGTTLQVIFAISAHFVNLLEPGWNLIEHAIQEPEKFIHGANILMNLLIASTLMFLGWRVYRYTGNIFYAVLLQLMPFSSYQILVISGRILPEAVMVAPLLLLALMIVKYLYDDSPEENTQTYLIGFAAIGGLGMASKFLYLPFLIIPFFLFPDWKQRIRYSWYTLVAIIVFAFPVFANPVKSWNWFSSLLVHSDKWGSGSRSFINLDEVPNRLQLLYQMDPALFIIAGFAILVMFIAALISWKRTGSVYSLPLRMLLSVITAFGFSLLITVKHFEPHYFIPALVFKMLFIYLVAEILSRLFPVRRFRSVWAIAALLAGLMLAIVQKAPLNKALGRIEKRSEIFEGRAQILKSYTDSDKILILAYYYRGSPFVESALSGGVLMSGSLKITFLPYLMEEYPNTFIYYDWSEKFYHWDQFVEPSAFIDPSASFYVFIGEQQEGRLARIIERMQNDFPGYQFESRLLYHFTPYDEYFYEVLPMSKK